MMASFLYPCMSLAVRSWLGTVVIFSKGLLKAEAFHTGQLTRQLFTWYVPAVDAS